MKLTRITWLVPAVAAVTLVSACGSSGGTGASSAGGKGGDASISVGVLPLADYGPVYWAQDHGIFKKHGLKVTLKPLQGGPIGTQEVAAGQLQFSFSNPISSAIATNKGAPIQTVAVSSGWGAGELGVFVKPGSPIKTMADLNGKTVGINTTQNVGDILFANLAKAKGLNTKPSWVEVPFAEMIDGVKNGSIQAGYLPEPYATSAKDAGLRDVVGLIQADNVGLPGASFVTSTSYAKSNPAVVKEFAASIDEARTYIAGHLSEFRAWLPKSLGTSAAAAKSMHLPDFSVGLTTAGMQKVADILVGLGLVGKDYQAAKFTIATKG